MEGIEASTGRRLAVKIIDKQRLADDAALQQLLREIAILRGVAHRNIVRLEQTCRTANNVYLMLEFVDGGDLSGHLRRSGGRLAEWEARNVFRQLVAGLAYVHTLGIAHRDLKPDNLLLTADGVLKISDFGLARLQSGGTVGVGVAGCQTRCGTPSYVAPEVLSCPGGSAYNGFSNDVWAAGVVLFQLLSGRLPFSAGPHGSDLTALYRRITQCDYQMSRSIPAAAADIVSRVFVPEPDDRITLRAIINHPWFREGMAPADCAAFDALVAAAPTPPVGGGAGGSPAAPSLPSTPHGPPPTSPSVGSRSAASASPQAADREREREAFRLPPVAVARG